MKATDYDAFLESKMQLGGNHGFEPLWMPEWLYDFQTMLTRWAIQKGKAAIFADCGMGKTPMQLVWAENVVRHTNKPVLIATPLAVSSQTLREAEKFDIDCHRSKDGKHGKGIVVTNYERLHYFDPSEFAGMVADESSILKNFEGKTKAAITEFMRKLRYRLLCTATASPNDFMELGTSSEALGELGYMDMLGMFFKNDQASLHPMMRRGGNTDWWSGHWRFKRHAERDFWRWVCSWARAIRKPSDYGFDDGDFTLPPLIENETIVKAQRPMDGFLFTMPAIGLKEQRQERSHTVTERCEEVARKVSDTGEPAVCWCHLNREADLIEKLIPDALQISGTMNDDLKEERFTAFASGELRALVIKPKIGAFGLNWQHCSHMTVFPSHSFEQYYQGVRRCWRFGQKNPVTVDIITTEGEHDVIVNLKRKAEASDKLFTVLVKEMQHELSIKRSNTFTQKEEVPAWL